MSTIPSTPDSPSYTVLEHQGGERKRAPVIPFSIVLLHRGNRFERSEVFDRVHRLNALEVISIETLAPRFDLESYSLSYRELKFLIFSEAPRSIGAALNTAIHEARGNFVLVLWSDQYLLPVARAHLEDLEAASRLCTLPYLRNDGGAILPTIGVPAEYRRGLKIMRLVPGPDHRSSLYPFDFVGLYHRESFLQVEGFDTAITNPYWQTLDFGLRAWLWGYQLQASSALRVQSAEADIGENTSPDRDYARFYGKNLLPEFLADHGFLPWRRFFDYRRSSQSGFFEALREFRDLQAWVKAHRYRFRQEARYLVEFWDGEGSP